MRVLSWNCQGLGATLTGENLKRLCKKQQPEILFLMETRQSEDRIREWKRKLKFSDYFVVNPLRTGGGLAILWRDTVQVSILDWSPNYIDTQISFLSEAFSCKITWLYGTPLENAKVAFWNSMTTHFIPQSQPWLVIGDCNEITGPSDKWGGAPPDQWRLKLFQDFIDNGQLRDLHFQGPQFTWFVIRHGRVFIKQRLDRAMGNLSWCTAQPRTQIFHLPKLGSDHRSILLDTQPMEIRAPRPFRFEHFWITHAEFSSLIETIWKSASGHRAMSSWAANLTNCKNSIKSWCKEAFPNDLAETTSLLSSLENLLATPDSLVSPNLHLLNADIEKLWTQTEMFW